VAFYCNVRNKGLCCFCSFTKKFQSSFHEILNMCLHVAGRYWVPAKAVVYFYHEIPTGRVTTHASALRQQQSRRCLKVCGAKLKTHDWTIQDRGCYAPRLAYCATSCFHWSPNLIFYACCSPRDHTPITVRSVPAKSSVGAATMRK